MNQAGDRAALPELVLAVVFPLPHGWSCLTWPVGSFHFSHQPYKRKLVSDIGSCNVQFLFPSSAWAYWINVWWPSNLCRNCIKAKWACSDPLALTGLWQVHSPEWTSSNETYLLLEMMGTLHPLIWFSSVSETSICSGRRGTQTVISKGALRCW